MRSRSLACLLVLAAALLATPLAWAETVTGRVYRAGDGDQVFTPGVDEPIANEAVFLRSTPLSAMPHFEGFAFTNAEGRYTIQNVPAGGTYQVNLPFQSPEVVYQRIQQTPAGPTPVPPFPSGFIPPTGPPTIVDLPIVGGSAPVFGISPIAANVVMGNLWVDAGIIAGQVGYWESRCSGVLEGNSWFLEGAEVVLTRISPSGPQVSLLTPVGGVFSFDAAPLGAGDTVEISVDPGQPALAGLYTVAGPTVFSRTWAGDQDDCGSSLTPVRFNLRPIGTIKGRVFVERDGADGSFNGSDVALGGIEVQLWSTLAPPPAAPLHTRLTDAAGLYEFADLETGIYLLQVVPASGIPKSGARQLQRPGPLTPMVVPDLDFAFPCDDFPAPPCCTGPLHSVLVETQFLVGDAVRPHAVFARLLDGGFPPPVAEIDRAHIYYGGSFPGPVSGANGVISIVSVDIAGGVATVRVRLEAATDRFPAGFFGDTLRRLDVMMDGRWNSADVRLTCDDLHPGALFPWHPLCGTPAACGEAPVIAPGCPPLLAPRFEVVSNLDAGLWRWCNPLPACPASSSDAQGGVNQLTVDVDFLLPAAGAGHTLQASLRCGTALLGSLSHGFAGTTWNGSARQGGVELLQVQQVAGSLWRARLRIHAGVRPDGNPARLGERPCTLDVRLDGVRNLSFIVPARLSPIGLILVRGSLHAAGIVEWLSGVDAAACQ